MSTKISGSKYAAMYGPTYTIQYLPITYKTSKLRNRYCSLRLLFTGNIPRGVFCERRSQKTQDIPREFMRLA